MPLTLQNSGNNIHLDVTRAPKKVKPTKQFTLSAWRWITFQKFAQPPTYIFGCNFLFVCQYKIFSILMKLLFITKQIILVWPSTSKQLFIYILVVKVRKVRLHAFYEAMQQQSYKDYVGRVRPKRAQNFYPYTVLGLC